MVDADVDKEVMVTDETGYWICLFTGEIFSESESKNKSCLLVICSSFYEK